LRLRSCLALGLAAIASLPGPALADGLTDLEAVLEEPVLSTATRTAETRAAAPATSTIITAEDLWRFGIRSLDEAINYLSLGMFTQDPLHAVEIGARGVLLSADYGNHVLLLVDGHALNEQWDGTAYFERGAAVPFELIDHIEVIVGPGSVLYGSNAMFGVIHIFTKRAKDYRGAHVVLDVQLPTAFKAGAGAGYEFKLFGVPAEITAQLEYYGQRGPAFTFGPQSYGIDAVTGRPKRFGATGPATGVWGGAPSQTYFSQVPAGYVRFIAGNFEVSLRSAMYRRGNPYVDVTNTFPFGYNDRDSFELDRWLSVDVKHRATLSPIVSLSSRAYGDTYDYQQRAVTYAAEDCLPGQLEGCQRHLIGVSRWLGAEERASFDWTKDGRFETQIGVEGRLRFVGSKDDITDRATGVVAGSLNAYQHYERALAIYGQQTARPLKWLALNAGARFDLDERFGSRISPRAAVVVNPWQSASIKAIYAEAFRAPTAYESFFTDPTIQLAPDHLKPEVTRSVEGIFEQRLGTHRVMAGVFRTFFSDMVSLTSLTDAEIAAAVAAGKLQPGTPFALQYRNVATIDSYGFEAAIDGSALRGRFRYGLNVTGAYVRRRPAPGAPLEQLPVAPSLFGNARISYELGGYLPTLALAGLAASARLADQGVSGAFQPVPYAPPQLQGRLTISGRAPLAKGLSYRLSGEISSSGRNPYVVGPNQAATPQQPSAELVPVVQYRCGLGLLYDLPF
jgi:outer membrane receptor protein involved in Fe transport